MTATVSAADRPALLVAWLNELLYLLDVHRFIPRRCRIREFRNTALVAELFGDTIDPNRHSVRRMVKAATYHGLSLTQANGGWEARVILDL
jgi:SHS2 domain-containing protein